MRNLTKRALAVPGLPVAHWLIRRRFQVGAVADGLLWAVALAVATVARYDFRLSLVHLSRLLVVVPLAVLLQILFGHLFGLYTGRSRFGSFDEVLTLFASVTATGISLLVADLMRSPRPIPLGGVVGGTAMAVLSMCAVRYGWRLLLESRRRPSGDGVERLIVFGAGEAGAQVLTAMLRDPHSPYLPVALIDDDQAKRNLRIMGVAVFGNRTKIGDAAQALGATSLLIALPEASGAQISELTDVAQAANLAVKVLPPVAERFSRAVDLADIRDLAPADLLGRHEIETDLASIASYITGKRVLVTGAGGSIGSELCRQLYSFAPAELMMLDHDESALHAIQLAIEGRALLDSPSLILADIRDQESLCRIIGGLQPEVVFHAAALKHLTLLERYPSEALKTNVWGTLAVLEAARSAGVERFVNISTDKAADPQSVLGYSKRAAERLTADYADRCAGRYLSVRFGNVLGSRGSMLGTFQAQIEAGGPITVTDPEVTRYFMTVQEAVQLVIQAGAIGKNGEVLVLDMGDPVRIADVAKRLAAQSDRPISITFTGLRPGEKLHEVLLGRDEPDNRPVHPLISHVKVPAVQPECARGLDVMSGPDALIKQLRDLCGVGLRDGADR